MDKLILLSTWNLYLNKHMEALEVVQRRATKRIPRLRHICYEERLRMLDLIALKKIRIRRDVIQQFKIEHGLDLVN